MIIGILTVSLHIPLCNSLKEKRRHLSSLKTRLSSAFNVSVAEVDEHDKWQRSVVAVVHVGVTRPVVDSVLSRIASAVEDFKDLQVLDTQKEMLS